MARRQPKTSAADHAKGARAQRRARKIIQLALAEALGITFDQLQARKPDRSRLSARQLRDIAAALGVPPAAPAEAASKTDKTPAKNLTFLETAGAMRLMHAYAALPTPRMKRALVRLAEQMAGVET